MVADRGSVCKRKCDGRTFRMLSGMPGRNGRTAVIDLVPPVERAFLVAVDTGDDEGWTAEESLRELASRADTAGAGVGGAEGGRAECHTRRDIDPNWYSGKAKAEQPGHAKAEITFTMLIAHDELSP